jgi:hypothetical protein
MKLTKKEKRIKRLVLCRLKGHKLYHVSHPRDHRGNKIKPYTYCLDCHWERMNPVVRMAMSGP